MPGHRTDERIARRTLVLGGTRSGKSAYAEDLLPSDIAVRYLATARAAGDAEWSARIAAHRARRPPGWSTEEEPDLPVVLGTARPGEHLLVDDLATWLTGRLDDAGAWDHGPDATVTVARQCDALIDAVGRCPARLTLVSAEVGLGVVPSTRSGRLFRDELGTLNTRLARVCDRVVLLVAGIPLTLR